MFKDNMIGEKFGKWLVKERVPNIKNYITYKVICECGVVKNIDKYTLKSGKSKSCGCGRFSDLTGKNIGNLKVLKKILKDNNSIIYWNCICNCGKEKILSHNYLIKNKKNKEKSCGCLRKDFKKIEDITGEKFNRLLVLKRVCNIEYKSKSVAARWLCRCDCGKEVVCIGKNLKNNNTYSCGCYRNEKYKTINYKGCGNLSKTHFYRIQIRAKNRNLEFSISEKYLWDLFLKQDMKCALTGIKIILNKKHNKHKNNTASLDRIDSKKGYIEGNVQWVHKKINLMKSNIPQKQFIKYCELIYKNKIKNETT